MQLRADLIRIGVVDRRLELLVGRVRSFVSKQIALAGRSHVPTGFAMRIAGIMRDEKGRCERRRRMSPVFTAAAQALLLLLRFVEAAFSSMWVSAPALRNSSALNSELSQMRRSRSACRVGPSAHCERAAPAPAAVRHLRSGGCYNCM
jgi:hypothetical protein